MAKLLEKIIKDAIEDGKYSFGTKETISTIKNSKVPTLHYNGSSVELGRLCGTQFRISALSLKTLSDINLKAITKELETETN